MPKPTARLEEQDRREGSLDLVDAESLRRFGNPVEKLQTVWTTYRQTVRQSALRLVAAASCSAQCSAQACRHAARGPGSPIPIFGARFGPTHFWIKGPHGNEWGPLFLCTPPAMSALPPKADMCGALAQVCFGPIADILAQNVHSVGFDKGDYRRR